MEAVSIARALYRSSLTIHAACCQLKVRHQIAPGKADRRRALWIASKAVSKPKNPEISGVATLPWLERELWSGWCLSGRAHTPLFSLICSFVTEDPVLVTVLSAVYPWMNETRSLDLQQSGTAARSRLIRSWLFCSQVTSNHSVPAVVSVVKVNMFPFPGACYFQTGLQKPYNFFKT